MTRTKTIVFKYLTWFIGSLVIAYLYLHLDFIGLLMGIIIISTFVFTCKKWNLIKNTPNNLMPVYSFVATLLLVLVTVNYAISTDEMSADYKRQVDILSDKFDLENRPWMKISKIEYELKQENGNSVSFVKNIDGTAYCTKEGISQAQCTDELLNPVSEIHIFYYAENVGRIPAEIVTTPEIYAMDVIGSGEIPENFCFPDDEILILHKIITFNNPIELKKQNISSKGYLNYASPAKHNKIFKTNFSADFGIYKSSERWYANIIHELVT